MNDLEARLARCFAAVFPGMSREQIPAATVQTVEKWDSIATVTLLSALEQEFEIQFDPEDIENLSSFQAIRDHIRQKKTA